MSAMLLLCVLLVQIYPSIAVISERESYILMQNLARNLDVDPRLTNAELSIGESEAFIKKQFEKLWNISLHQDDELDMKYKRSPEQEDFPEDLVGTYLLDEVTTKYTVPVSFPEDIKLFEQNGEWYAIAIESQNAKGNSSSLVVFKLQNDSFVEFTKIDLHNGIRIATFTLGSITLISVAQNMSLTDSNHQQMGIYEFTTNGLKKLQNIETEFASDVEMWTFNDDLFMSIVQFMSKESDGNQIYELDAKIYEWKNRKFLEFDRIHTNGARKITPFFIGDHHFLAVANFLDDSGDTRIFSEIYQYNKNKKKYEIYSFLSTAACTDIQHFTMIENNSRKDDFLVVANSYWEDIQGTINHETESIIYKFVDDYFIPFQTLRVEGLQKWVPVQGFNNEFALFAISRFHGIIPFQYDGWEFVENPINLPTELHRREIRSLRAHLINNTILIVVANKLDTGEAPNVYELKFKHENQMHEFQDEIHNWCEEGLARMDEVIAEITEEDILGDVSRSDIEIDESDEDLDKINSKLLILNRMLDDMENSNAHQPPPEVITIPENVTQVIFNDVVTIKKLGRVIINGQQVDFNELHVENLEVTGKLNIQRLNGKPFEKLARDDEDVFLEKVDVIGTVHAKGGMEIAGTLNGIRFEPDNILLAEGDQTITKSVQFRDIEVDLFEAEAINGRTISCESPLFDLNIREVKNLTVHNLTIGGYINGVHMPTLYKYALRKEGDQEITAEYTFENLHGDHLLISNEASAQMQPEETTFDEDVLFRDEIEVEQLIVTEFLCGISVDENGKLDLVMNNSNETQYITGKKIFDNLTVNHPISLQGKIESEVLERLDPVVTIEKPLVIERNITINGTVTIEKSLNASDVKTSDLRYSIKKLQTHGLKLTDTNIEQKLNFVQQLNVKNIAFERVNGMLLENFVRTNTDEEQIITGLKHFSGDLNITGHVKLVNVNNIDLESLKNNILYIDGDQNITAKHYIDTVITDKVFCNKTVFVNPPKGKHVRVIDGDLNVDYIRTKSLSVKGLINHLNFTEIVADTVMKNSTRQITGTKHFKNLTIGDYTVKTGLPTLDLTKIFDPQTGVFVLDRDVVSSGMINCTELIFEKDFNGVSKEEFGKFESFSETGTRILTGDFKINRLTIHGNVTIAETINGVNVTDLLENTVKLDEPHNFTHLIFESTVTANEIILDGDIEHVDLNNIFQPNSKEPQTLHDKVSFSNLTVNGTVKFNKLVNGMNLGEFSKYATDSTGHVRNITIQGNVYFNKAVEVEYVNGHNVQYVIDNAWLSDQNVTLSGPIEFEDAIFEDNIEVKNFMDNVNVTWISENYLSKTKDQVITATYTIENDLFFKGNVTAKYIDVGGEINGINLDQFLGTALLKDCDQMFETTPFFENVTINKLGGDFTVNGLDLDKDVMRHDRVNLVTGKKTFKNLNVHTLKIEKNIKVQNVDVMDWMNRSVMTYGVNNITGTKYFRNVKFEQGVDVAGTINGLKFDDKHIMLKNGEQNITGAKHFIAPSASDPVDIEFLQLHGKLNNVDMKDLLNTLAFRDQNNTFTSPLILANNITADNIIFKNTFRGIDMGKLIENVTNMEKLNRLTAKVHEMEIMAEKMAESYRDRAYYLSHYDNIQEIPGLRDSRIFTYMDGSQNLAMVNDTQIGIYELTGEQFSLDPSVFYVIPEWEFSAQVFLNRYIYVETKDKRGIFFEFTDELDQISVIVTNRTVNTASFLLPSTQEYCSIFLYDSGTSNILCEDDGQIRLMQELETPDAFEAIFTEINGYSYLILLQKCIEHQLSVWMMREEVFVRVQTSMIERPESMSVVSYKHHHFIAVASGDDGDSLGKVSILRFESATNAFRPWQTLRISSPVQVAFRLLPTSALVLYVVTDDENAPLVVCQYEGVVGFRVRVVEENLPKIRYINTIETDRAHYVLAQGYDNVNVIKAHLEGGAV